MLFLEYLEKEEIGKTMGVESSFGEEDLTHPRARSRYQHLRDVFDERLTDAHRTVLQGIEEYFLILGEESQDIFKKAADHLKDDPEGFWKTVDQGFRKFGDTYLQSKDGT